MPKLREPKQKPYRFVPLPDNFRPLDATIEEVCAFRRELRWSVFQKLKDGTYESYLDGRVRQGHFRQRARRPGPRDSRLAATKSTRTRCAPSPAAEPLARWRRSPSAASANRRR